MSNITGSIKVIDVPDNECLSDVPTLLKQLEKYLAVELDASAVTNVVVSSEEPETSARDIIWFRTNASGNFVGVHVFVLGEWAQVFPHPTEIKKVYGNSDEVDVGWELITEDTPGFTSEMVEKLMEEWVRDPSDSYWQIYHVVYVGL